MARKATKNRKRGARRLVRVLALLDICTLLFFGYMGVCARVVHVRYATVWLEDLPGSFDGLKILYVSDVDLVGGNTAGRAARLMARLSRLEPDVLLLGGDYANPSLWDRLNGRDASDAELAGEMAEKRGAFFSALADFPAPLGKYAIAGENDAGVGDLARQLADVGIRYLNDNAAMLVRGDGQVALFGLCTGAGAGAASRFRQADLVVALTHSPENLAAILTTEAADGGQWADLILTGHTHGGQMRVFERTLFSLTDRERESLSGWKKYGSAFLLTSQGIGCEAINLRLHSQAEAHLITLRCKEG